MTDSSGNIWLTSKEILKKTGISRATLNNYIKMGILPKPVVKKAGPDQKGIKQIGYFPEIVLQNIEDVKRLKREGKTMSEIEEHFKEVPEAPQVENDRQEVPPPIKEPVVYSRKSRRTMDSNLKLTLEDIQSPAYLINHNFEIEWINKEAEEHVFNKSVSSVVDVDSRNLFKLFFSYDFHSHINNWADIVEAHLKVVHSKLTRTKISTLYNGISENEISFINGINNNITSYDQHLVHNIPIQFDLSNGETESYQIYTLSFREGIFFVFIPTDKLNHEILNMLSHRESIINELLKQRMPSLHSMCVLVADLQDSVKISSELLPGEYFELVNELWKTVGNSFDKYNGIYGKHSGDGMLYYFIKRPGSNYLMDAINCALELRDKMREFSAAWKLRKGWLNDIYLNTAINEGQEFFGAIHSSSNVEFTALGDTINYAGRLSDFARYGSIWTTKNVISKMEQNERDSLRFGVYRKENDRKIFIKNSFSRVVDLLEKNNQKYCKFLDIATLPITEIIEKV